MHKRTVYQSRKHSEVSLYSHELSRCILMHGKKVWNAPLQGSFMHILLKLRNDSPGSRRKRTCPRSTSQTQTQVSVEVFQHPPRLVWCLFPRVNVMYVSLKQLVGAPTLTRLSTTKSARSCFCFLHESLAAARVMPPPYKLQQTLLLCVKGFVLFLISREQTSLSHPPTPFSRVP